MWYTTSGVANISLIMKYIISVFKVNTENAVYMSMYLKKRENQHLFFSHLSLVNTNACI